MKCEFFDHNEPVVKREALVTQAEPATRCGKGAESQQSAGGSEERGVGGDFAPVSLFQSVLDVRWVLANFS